MLTIFAGELHRKITTQLKPKYGFEAETLSSILLEDLLELTKNEILLNEEIVLKSKSVDQSINNALALLLKDIPIQYILGKADFYGYKFKVSTDTLIPRQETEELVLEISRLIDLKHYKTLLDIGTGSGCIPVTIALEHPGIKTVGIDISRKALEVARQNAKVHNAAVDFIEADIFEFIPSDMYDIIVSNPPYVKESEKQKMAKNVVEHEPEIALYVPDYDPLIFYNRIASIAVQVLNPGGLLAFEINEEFGKETAAILDDNGFIEICINKDLNNKPRFVYGILP